MPDKAVSAATPRPRSLTARTLRAKIDPAYRQFVAVDGLHRAHRGVIEWDDLTIVYCADPAGAKLVAISLRRAGYKVETGLDPSSLRVEIST